MSEFWNKIASTTAHLSTTEYGAYRLLLEHYIGLGGKIVATRQQLLRVCRAVAKAEVEAVAIVLKQFFLESDGIWVHPDADAMMQKKREISAKRAVSGSAGGSKKAANARLADAKQLLPLSSSSFPNGKKKKEARGRAGASETPAPPAAQEQLAAAQSLIEHAPDWGDEDPVWAEFKRMMPVREWAMWFAKCRPNGSPLTIVAPRSFDAAELEKRYGPRLERHFGQPITFKSLTPKEHSQ